MYLGAQPWRFGAESRAVVVQTGCDAGQIDGRRGSSTPSLPGLQDRQFQVAAKD